MIKKKWFLMWNQKKQWKSDKKWQKNTLFEETQEKKEVIFTIKKWPPQSACHGSAQPLGKGVKRGAYL